MNRWVDFRELKQSIGIEQVLASYRVELKRVGHNQLRGPCPLPRMVPSGAGRVLAWTPQRRCGPVIRPLAVRYARGE
jgi:hypothetical protein